MGKFTCDRFLDVTLDPELDYLVVSADTIIWFQGCEIDDEDELKAIEFPWSKADVSDAGYSALWREEGEADAADIQAAIEDAVCRPLREYPVARPTDTETLACETALDDATLSGLFQVQMEASCVGQVSGTNCPSYLVFKTLPDEYIIIVGEGPANGRRTIMCVVRPQDRLTPDMAYMDFIDMVFSFLRLDSLPSPLRLTIA